CLPTDTRVLPHAAPTAAMQPSDPTSNRGRSRSSQQFDPQVLLNAAGFSPKAPQRTHQTPGVTSQPRGHRVASPAPAVVRGIGRGADS
ncbi:unnamed protein product, partial [Ectocarpus fasciculatus]